MKILFLLFVGILFSIEIHAQEKNLGRQPVPCVIFKKVMNQNDNFLMIKTDDRRSYHEDSIRIISFSEGRRLLGKKKLISGSVDLIPVHEWWAWLLDRTLPQEVKQLFDLSPRYKAFSYGFMYSNLYSYGNVVDQVEVKLWFNDVFEIIQIGLEFIEPDLLKSISDEQLKSICTRLLECQISAKEVFRCLAPSEGGGEEEINKEKVYSINVYVNGALKWGEKCKTEKPERWEAIAERFEQIIAARDTNCVVVNAQVSVDTIFLGSCELLKYSDALSIFPKEHRAIMDPFFAKGENVSVDLLGIPVEIDPELDIEKYQEAVELHPWTRWVKELEERIFNTDLMKMISNRAGSLGLRSIYGSIYFDKKGNLLSYVVNIPSDILDSLTKEQLEQFQVVCFNEAEGGRVPGKVLNSVFLRLSSEEFLESMKELVLEYQKKMKKGVVPYKGHFFNHFLPIKDRPKSDYGELRFKKFLKKTTEGEMK